MIQERIGHVNLADIPIELQDRYEILEPLEPAACKPDIDDFGNKVYDTLISAEVMLPLDGVIQPARVTGRKRDSNGNCMGMANSNPSWTAMYMK